MNHMTWKINKGSAVHGLRTKKNAVKNFLIIGQKNSKTDYMIYDI